MHTITERHPTLHEQRLIARRVSPDLASYGCITLGLGIGPVYILGKLGAWLGALVSPAASAYGQYAGWCIAAIILVLAIVSFNRYERRLRQLAERDRDARVVQDIHVTDPRVVEIALINDNEPILAFDVGDNTILFLQGQWLRDCDIYGTEGPDDDDPYEEFFNGIPEPYSFPATEFTVSRLPNSGEVLAISVAGQYLAPKEVVEALKPEYEFVNSELFEGPLEDIAGVLAREHSRRNAK